MGNKWLDSAKKLRTHMDTAASFLTDEQAVRAAGIFPAWKPDLLCERGYRARDGGELYQAIHGILDASQNIRPSEDTTNQLWQRIGNPADEWPEWYQYIAGVGDPWRVGDKCSYKGAHWICRQGDASGQNSYAPDVWGWEEVA